MTAAIFLFFVSAGSPLLVCIIERLTNFVIALRPVLRSTPDFLAVHQP